MPTHWLAVSLLALALLAAQAAGQDDAVDTMASKSKRPHHMHQDTYDHDNHPPKYPDHPDGYHAPEYGAEPDHGPYYQHPNAEGPYQYDHGPYPRHPPKGCKGKLPPPCDRPMMAYAAETPYYDRPYNKPYGPHKHPMCDATSGALYVWSPNCAKAVTVGSSCKGSAYCQPEGVTNSATATCTENGWTITNECIPGCKGFGETCTSDDTCCTRVCDIADSASLLQLGPGACCDVKLAQRGQSCQHNEECCSNNCRDVKLYTCSLATNTNRQLCCPPNTKGFGEHCDRSSECCSSQGCTGAATCDASCFSAESKVNIQESSQPVTMRELKTGQHVECIDSGDDFMTPKTTQFCEVMAWVHADEAQIRQQRIAFKKPDGTSGSVTLAQPHLVHKLTSKTAVGAHAATVTELGAYQLQPAVKIQPGDKIVVTLKDQAGTVSFAAVNVDRTEIVSAKGLYLPVIEQPYIVVDGVVMPLWTTMRPQLVAPQEAAGAQNALLHMMFSPLYMQRLQPEGTPGLNGQWDGKPLWPGVDAVLDKMNQHKGMAVDFMAVQKLFKPKYDAWRAARGSANAKTTAPVVTLEHVLSKINKVLVPGQS